MHDKFMMTLTCAHQPTLSELARAFGVPLRAFDSGFGVVCIHPMKRLYAVLVDSAFGADLVAENEDSCRAIDHRIESFSSVA